MATIDDIQWSKYKDWTGPFYRGKCLYHLPPDYSQNDAILSVITATEGGRWDAYNGYDVCICSSGLIQFCERGQYSVSDMLGSVAASRRDLLKPVDDMTENSGIEFKTNEKGRYRFFFKNELGEIDTEIEQRQMFLLHSSGKIGTWDDESTAYAKKWAASISTVWENIDAQKIQLDFTVKRLMWFLLPYSKNLFSQAPATNVGNAFKAAYLSYGANNPTWANNHLTIAVQNSNKQTWSQDWLNDVLRELTFGPNVTIYPIRYNAIRPVLEKLYGIDLPDFADDLKNMTDQVGESLWSVKEIQKFLLDFGYDLGPKRDDGVLGNKTKDAIMSFQQTHGINPTGSVDLTTQQAMILQRDAGKELPEDVRQRVNALVAQTLFQSVRDLQNPGDGSLV